MGNCLSCFNRQNPQSGSSPTDEGLTNIEQASGGSAPTSTLDSAINIQQTSVSGSATTKDEVINSLKAVSDTADLKEFVDVIKKVLDAKKSNKASTSEASTSETESAKENKGMWKSFITSGAKFLKFMNEHTEKIKDEKDIFSSGNSTIVADILGQIGKLHWVVGGLAIAAYLIDKINYVSANVTEALELLTNMVDLATTVVKLRDVLPEEEEKMKNAVMLIVQGSIMCVSQIHLEFIFSFLKTSVNSENLKWMSERLNHLYRDITAAITTASLKRQSEMAERLSEMQRQQPKFLPVQKPKYPKDAVGIENTQQEVIDLLDITSGGTSRLVVVIYGFGGIVKTTLAEGVIAKLNLNGYNYARALMDEDPSKNDLKEMQIEILNDAFPKFQSGAVLKLRDCKDGRDRLEEAFGCQENRPIFIYIDNVFRSEDLRELLPDKLSELPNHSRIFITTRMLNSTDVLLNSGVTRRDFRMKPLDDQHAVEILCKDPHNRERIKDDLEKILRVCGGVPLVLRIVGAQLVKMEYNARKCRETIRALEKGDYEGDGTKLSRRLVDLVYNELGDATKDAFLDICCFFSGWLRRHVEYIVGAHEVKSLEETALVTSFVDDKDMAGIYGSEERLIVHDILRATGRYKSTSTRFMDVESFHKAAQDESKLNGVKGLWIQIAAPEFVLDVKHLESMSHSLRILHLGLNTRMNAQSPLKFEELRYLGVDNRKVGNLPMKLEELDMLGVYKCSIEGISTNKLPKDLSMIHCSPYANPGESSLSIQSQYLEELNLHVVKDIRLLEGFHELRKLKILSLDMSTLPEFPEQVCKLSSLRNLRIFGWINLKRLPQSFGLLKRLTHLEISYCDELKELPSSFSELTAVEHLSLEGCMKLEQLPGGLESLKYLKVSSSKLRLESYRSKIDLRIIVTRMNFVQWVILQTLKN